MSGEFGNMNRFDISVIVPCFKPEARFLRQCLHSLYGQTLPHSRYEVILILNGCGEPWLSVANDMIGAFAPDFNITLLHTMERGVSNARNLGLDAARGEYIAFVDYDDYVSGPYLESLLRVASPTVVALSDAFPFHDGCAGVMDDCEAQCHKAWSQYRYGRLHLCMAITRIWCRAPFRYNWPFALSRYLGASKAVLNRCRIELRRLLLLPRWRR